MNNNTLRPHLRHHALQFSNALHCSSVMHCTALHCTALQFSNALHCTALHCTALHCIVLKLVNKTTRTHAHRCLLLSETRNIDIQNPLSCHQNPLIRLHFRLPANTRIYSVEKIRSFEIISKLIVVVLSVRDASVSQSVCLSVCQSVQGYTTTLIG